MDGGFVSIILICVFLVCQVVPLLLYEEVVKGILAKDRSWPGTFFSCLCALGLFALVAFFSTGRLGYTLEFLDTEVDLEKGVFLQYLGFSFLVQTFGIVVASLKYLWSLLRRKEGYSWKVLGIEFLFAPLFAVLGILMLKDEHVFPLGSGSDLVYILAAVLLIFGVYRGIAGFRKKGPKGAPANGAARAPQQAQPAGAGAAEETGAAGSQEAEALNARFEQVLTQRKRLEEQGDTAGQIQLLLEATALPASAGRKAEIWNLLALAYGKANSPERSGECFQTALRFDRNNPWILNNYAMQLSQNGQQAAARKQLEAAIPEAVRRGKNPGLFYANYALVTGRGGNRAEAEEYLQKALNAGYSPEAVQRIRGKLSL